MSDKTETPKPRKKPGPPPTWTPEEMADALIAANGLLSRAAKRLGCSISTVFDYCQKHPQVQAARREAEERVLDFAEGKLMEAINEGDKTAIIFFLKCKGKKRGYTERPEHYQNQMDSPTLKIEFVKSGDLQEDNQ